MIWLQSNLHFLSFLLLSATCVADHSPDKTHKRQSSESKDPVEIFCAYYDSDFNLQRQTCSAPTEYCGINKAGQIEGCVSADQCPVSGVTDRTIVCQTDKPSCCCLNAGDSVVLCNDIRSVVSDIPWKQACSLPELEGLSVCKVNPTNRVFCSYGKTDTTACKAFEFCGIDKNDGKLQQCLRPRDCPASAKGSEQIVCDSSSSFCCCQKPASKFGDTNPCNNILNRKDNTIWEQACGLPELENLEICKTRPTLAPTSPTLKPSHSSTLSGNPGKNEKAQEQGNLTDGEIVGIVIGLIIALLIIGAIIYCCYKKGRKNGYGRAPVQGQQPPSQKSQIVQSPANQQRQEPAVYYDYPVAVEQGYYTKQPN